MHKWLLSRLFETTDQPNPRFAFYGTVNWMRALALSVDLLGFENADIRVFYKNVQARPVNEYADTAVFESVFMAFNHLAGLSAISNELSHPYDASRSAILAWYYTVYFSAVAMVAASQADGAAQSFTAEAWQGRLVDQGLVLAPFSPSLSSLIGPDCLSQIAAYRASNRHDLNHPPEDLDQAWGAIVSYLKGTADYEREKVEERVRETPEFKALHVDNFRTNLAKAIRDQHLARGFVNFVVQASRYRGKANYRDSIFLSYGDGDGEQIDQFLVDLKNVGEAFFRMACGYCSRRVEDGTWEAFVADIEMHSKLSLDASLMRIEQ